MERIVTTLAPTPLSHRLRDAALALVLACAATVGGVWLRGHLTPSDIIMIYLAASVFVAARLGLMPALVYAAASVGAFNYFFIEPRYSFDVANPSYWLTFAVMLSCSVLIALQAAALREKVFLAQERERQARALYDLKVRNMLLRAIPHDLKTPLSAMIAASESLLRDATALGADEVLLVRTIHDQSLRFSRTVNNLLDLARIGEGPLPLNTAAYDPAELIGIALQHCAGPLQSHSVSVDAAADLPFIRVDGLLLTQLLQNLIDNAARHTPAGTHIHVAAELARDAFVFSVADDGPGLAPGQETGLLAGFAQDASSAKSSLGLAICQAVAQAHGATLQARNQPDGGAEFILRLPASVVVAETSDA